MHYLIRILYYINTISIVKFFPLTLWVESVFLRNMTEMLNWCIHYWINFEITSKPLIRYFVSRKRPSYDIWYWQLVSLCHWTQFIQVRPLHQSIWELNHKKSFNRPVLNQINNIRPLKDWHSYINKNRRQ